MTRDEKEVTLVLDLMLKAFMEDELKWYPVEKDDAVAELNAAIKRVNDKLWGNRQLKRQVQRQRKRLNNWNKEFPLHRIKRFYTIFSVASRSSWNNSYHVMFDITNAPEKLECYVVSCRTKKITSSSITKFFDDAISKQWIRGFRPSGHEVSKLNDDIYPGLITMHCLICKDSVVQNLEDIPEATL
jgi:hypothetical protein